MNEAERQSEYRKLPAVDALLHMPAIALLAAEVGAERMTETLRSLLAQARAAIAAGQPAPDPDAWPALAEDALTHAMRPSLRPVINATGVIVHTNLGRAPLSSAARQAVNEVAAGYSNLEYDLEGGARGSRYDHARAALCELTGAEDALIVNNNAGAVYLVLAALCAGREVLISRGQLVEIGGGFRIPDVLRQSGARLVEVGTTNRTHVRDFVAALSPQTAAIMRVHSSNFRQIGFVTEPRLEELAEIVHAQYGEAGEPALLIDDLGSGTLLATADYGLAPEPMVQESLAAGADIVTFSGDKLLGGPQAGLILGRAELIAHLRRHPMTRALRVDKMTLAALDATLRSYRRGRAAEEIPVWRMIAAQPEALRARAEEWLRQLSALVTGDAGVRCAVWPGESAVGGGSLPGETLSTTVLAVQTQRVDAVAAAIRNASPPVVCRIQKEHLLLDPRTVLPEQDEALLDTLAQALQRGEGR
jgi:L-seryl-tRNA(Ser) seleniumtransferase